MSEENIKIVWGKEALLFVQSHKICIQIIYNRTKPIKHLNGYILTIYYNHLLTIYNITVYNIWYTILYGILLYGVRIMYI